MARIRTVKPEFFRHEGLQDLEAENPGSYVMLVFAGLWGHCDKAGRFEWKPRTLKLDILPFLPFDMTETLSILESAGFIRSYAVDGKQYGEVPTFGEHQRLGGKEAQEPGKYPGSNGEAIGGSEPECSASSREEAGKRSGLQEGKGREGEEEKHSSSGDDPKTRALEERVAAITRDAIETWNESPLVTECGLASIRKSVGFDKRKAQVRRMLRVAREICQEQFGAQTVTRQFWVGLWKLYAKDEFYSGRQGGGKGHENWRPDFEFLTKEEQVIKLYDRVAPATEAQA